MSALFMFWFVPQVYNFSQKINQKFIFVLGFKITSGYLVNLISSWTYVEFNIRPANENLFNPDSPPPSPFYICNADSPLLVASV